MTDEWTLAGATSYTAGHGERDYFIRLRHTTGCTVLVERAWQMSPEQHQVAANLILGALNAA